MFHRTKHLLILTLLVLALVVGGCGKKEPTPVPTNTPAPTNTPKPTNTPVPTSAPAVALGAEERVEEGGFAYCPIPGYTVESWGRTVLMTAPDADPQTGPVFMLSGDLVEGAETLDEAWEFIMADFSGDGVEVSEAREITVDGAPGRVADITGEEEGVEIILRVAVVKPSPTQGFGFVGGSPVDVWESEVEALFEAVLASVTLFEPAAAAVPTSEVEETKGEEIRQWATSATASSQYGNSNWAASQAIGAPDTLECGDNITAWASSSSNGVDWLELGYDAPVHPTEVNIVQSYNPDQVVKVELLDTAGTYHEVYTGQPEDLAECPYTLSIPVEADYQAAGVKITVDQSVLGFWNEIDAVELVGWHSLESTSVVATPTPVAAAPKPVADLKPGWSIFSNANYVQDVAFHDGLVWAATKGGVAAWDPASGEATKYTTLDGLAHNVVNAITVCPVPEPRVFVGTKEGVSLYNPATGAWESVIPRDDVRIGNNSVASLACAPESGTLLIGYGSYGLHIWNSQSDEWRYINEKDDGLGSNFVSTIGVVGDLEEIWTSGSKTVSRITGEGITVYTKDDSDLLDTYIDTIVPDTAGNVWMGQFIGDELIRFHDETWSAYSGDNVEGWLMGGAAGGIGLAPDGTLWVISSFGGACHFDPATEKCLAIYDKEPGMLGFGVSRVVVDPQGNVYYGNDNKGEGISAFDGSGWRQFYLESDQLVQNSIQGMGLDHEGMIWIGTSSGGAQRLDPADAEAPWEHHTEAPNLSVNTFYADPRGGLWVGHGSGASFYDGANWTHIGKDEGIIPSVQAITVDGQGRAWFGTNYGLSIWDGQTSTNLTEEEGLPDEYVRALLTDGDVVWVGTASGGLLRFENDEFVVFNEDNGLPGNNVAALALDTDGSLLVGADDKLVRLDKDGQITELFNAESWSALITSIAVEQDGSLWLGDLFDGVYHFDGSEWHHLTTADGLPTNQFYETTVVIDHLGTVWFGGLDGGLARYVP